eukprot:SAG11_NODE_46967_length_132_cov_193.969697_1_plen_25_part_10
MNAVKRAGQRLGGAKKLSRAKTGLR